MIRRTGWLHRVVDKVLGAEGPPPASPERPAAPVPPDLAARRDPLASGPAPAGPGGAEPAPPPGTIGDPAHPRIGDHFWSIAPLSDALNMGVSPLEPWLGRISLQWGSGNFTLSLFHSGPPDALVGLKDLYTTEEEARDAYILYLTEEVATQSSTLSATRAKLTRWEQARAANLARPAAR